jgi:hypothetical protein
MGPADEFDGMVAALTHSPHLGNAHRNENV